MNEIVKDLDNLKILGLEDFQPGERTIVEAYYNDRKIAEFDFDCFSTIDGDIASISPHTLNVFYDKYKRKGIGTKIIEAVKTSNPNIPIIARNIISNIPEDKDGIYYTTEGLSFIDHCIKEGLIEPESGDGYNE